MSLWVEALTDTHTNSKTLLQTRSVRATLVPSLTSAYSWQVYLDGYHGDTSETFLIGQVDEVGRQLVENARRCRDEAIAACKPGAQLCVIGNTIRYTQTKYTHSEYTSKIHTCHIITFIFSNMPTNIFCAADSEIAHASGFQVCPYFIGHGIGSCFHCHPEIWHHGKFGSVFKLCDLNSGILMAVRRDSQALLSLWG